MTRAQDFTVGLTYEFQTEAAGKLEPALEQVFSPHPSVRYTHLPPMVEALPEVISRYDAIITLRPRFTAASLAGMRRLTVIARWGVGYDMIDVEACTANDVLLAITTDAVRKPVAEAILTLMLALAKSLPAKDRLARTGNWQAKGQIASLGLEGKVVGSVGLGSIGGEMFRLLRPFDLARMLAYDPYAAPGRADALGVEMVGLQTLFAESDFVAINCPLNGQTRGLVDAALLALMKPTAYLINTARGPIVRQEDLVEALRARRIAGAGLDVFDPEPLPADHPLARMDNVILAPHALAWTDTLYRDNSLGACRNVLSVLQGETPQHVVNPEVAGRPGFQAKLRSLRQRWERAQS